jgi:hypothetical protein
MILLHGQVNRSSHHIAGFLMHVCAVFKMCGRGIVLHGSIASTIAGMTVSEGVIRSLDPTFDLAKNSIPYFLRYGEQSIAARFSSRFELMLNSVLA